MNIKIFHFEKNVGKSLSNQQKIKCENVCCEKFKPMLREWTRWMLATRCKILFILSCGGMCEFHHKSRCILWKILCQRLLLAMQDALWRKGIVVSLPYSCNPRKFLDRFIGGVTARMGCYKKKTICYQCGILWDKSHVKGGKRPSYW